MQAGKLLVILDCCHAGGVARPKGDAAADLDKGFSPALYQRLAAGRGRVVLAASRDAEKSWVLDGDVNSLFTKHLLAGLRGGAPSDDGMVRIFDLFEYLQPRVTGEQRIQHPVFHADGLEENFPVALRLGGQKGGVARDDEGFRYDAYISYADREPDATWVKGTLLPRLQAAGLRVAMSEDVEEFGVSRIVNLERLIKSLQNPLPRF